MTKKHTDSKYHLKYAQDANALFTFTQSSDTLKKIIESKAFKPQFCVEDYSYLNLKLDNTKIENIAVLQSCFCDIPFSNLFKKNNIQILNEDDFTSDELSFLKKKNTHVDIYGEFGIAFSKEWGEVHGLQSIWYLNVDAEVINQINTFFNNRINSDVSDENSDNLLIELLAHLKPIFGTMKRRYDFENQSAPSSVTFLKNFSDEKEWRYIPNLSVFKELTFDELSYNSEIINSNVVLKNLNDSLLYDDYEKLWLKFSYKDIKYIILPDEERKRDFINFINNLPEEKFEKDPNIELQKDLLKTKIVLLEEIREDV